MVRTAKSAPYLGNVGCDLFYQLVEIQIFHRRCADKFEKIETVIRGKAHEFCKEVWAYGSH